MHELAVQDEGPGTHEIGYHHIIGSKPSDDIEVTECRCYEAREEVESRRTKENI